MRTAAIVLLALGLVASSPAAVVSGTVVKTAHNSAVKATILVDARGRTLYEFESDAGGQTTCTNDTTYHCSKHWLPLLTTGAPRATGAVKQGLLGTLKRPEGTVQVTYKHHPLYTWKGGYGTPGDRKPGDVNGQGFVSLWYVLAPTGKPLRK